jgi:methyltransferase
MPFNEYLSCRLPAFDGASLIKEDYDTLFRLSMNTKRVIFLVLIMGLVSSLIAFYDKKPLAIFFVVAVVTLSIERIWETFFLSSSKGGGDASRDLNFSLIVLAYFAILYGTVAEFFLLNRQGLIFLTLIGFSLLLISMALRFWAIRTLGPRWTTDISAEAASSVMPRKLSREGPYQYVRHPVYIGAILEVIAIALMGQALYMLVFVLAVSLPLYVIRARIEEGTLRKIFGDEYERYSAAVGAFVPLLNKSRGQYAMRGAENDK